MSPRQLAATADAITAPAIATSTRPAIASARAASRRRRARRAAPARQRRAACDRNLASGLSASGVVHVSSMRAMHGAKTSGENVVTDGDARRHAASLQVDPDVGNGWQAYGYADHNPVQNVDPTGLWSLNPANWDWADPTEWDWDCIDCRFDLALAAAFVGTACYGAWESGGAAVPLCYAALVAYEEIIEREECRDCFGLIGEACPEGQHPMTLPNGGYMCVLDEEDLMSWGDDMASGNYLHWDPHTDGSRPDPEGCRRTFDGKDTCPWDRPDGPFAKPTLRDPGGVLRR